ncbi:hypothetical protein BH09GEM1_BH09GEM1_04780 [soil metagenome]
MQLTLGATPIVPHESARAQSPDAATAATRAARTSAQSGDKVIVKVYQEPELSDSVTVTADGVLVLARIGRVGATNITIAALADTLRARYAHFLRSPVVSLAVLRRVVVNGEVMKPDVYYIDIATTLRDVIARSGGVTQYGDDAKVEIVRGGERIRVPDWQHDTTFASDLNSGDQIVVGRRSWISLNAFSAISAVALIVSLVVSLRR